MLYVLFFVVSGCLTEETQMSSEEDYVLGSDVKEHDDASDHLSDDNNNDNDFFELHDTTTDTDGDDDFSPQVITRDFLLAKQRDVLQTVMNVLMVGESHARTLLIHYHWDVEKLVTMFVEKGRDHFFAEAGVKMVVQGHDLGTCSSPSSIVFCDICRENVQCNEATKMDCQHTYCNDCWTNYFDVQIEGYCRRIKCMAYKCNNVCDEFVIRNLISKRNQDLVKKFDQVLLESYIEGNKLIKWCPSDPHCGNAIRVHHRGVLSEVRCKCGLNFCFNCLSEAHSPCSCLMWDLWNKKLKDVSSLSINWIAVNTKKCPSCYKPVQKDGGCKIISCVCRERFCWECLEVVIGHHNCSHSPCVTYVESPNEVESERKTLCRYMHYYKRFNAHRDSLKLKTKLVKMVRERISSSEKQTGLQDFSWLEKGMCLLFRSRRTLSCSYAFAYYMFGDELFKDYMSKEARIIKQNLFECHQHQLEHKVEELSRLIKEPFDKYSVDDIIFMKSKVDLLCNVVGNFCRFIYDYNEDDLSGCLPCNNDHDIAPYRSDRVESAHVLSAN